MCPDVDDHVAGGDRVAWVRVATPHPHLAEEAEQRLLAWGNQCYTVVQFKAICAVTASTDGV
jgi:hypothetical protein